MANQFNDLPQIPAFAEDPNLTQWGSSHRYMQAPKQYYGHPVPDEGAMYNDFKKAYLKKKKKKVTSTKFFRHKV